MATSLALIDAIVSQRSRLQEDAPRRERLAQLQQWQLTRLRRTYADFERDQRFAAALEFFAEDLYGPHEFGRRDADLRKVLRTWERVLPKLAQRAITGALELEALSLVLDESMIDALGAAKVDEQSYANAYRTVGRRTDRARQIRLIVDAGAALNELIRLPAIGAALRLARTPAKLAHVTALHAFLERGYSAFARMRDAAPLLDAIGARERRIMDALFAGAARPFQTPADPA